MEHRFCQSLEGLSAVLLGLWATGVRADVLHVIVDGVQGSQGRIAVALFEQAEGFPDEGMAQGIRLSPEQDGPVVRFDGLAPGRYAVAAFHDQNGNGKLDRGAFGLPLEPYGFSNEARSLLGVPSFAEAAVPVSGESRIVVELR